MTFQEVAENPVLSSGKYITFSALISGNLIYIEVYGRKSGLICADSLNNLVVYYDRNEFTCLIDQDFDNELIYLKESQIEIICDNEDWYKCRLGVPEHLKSKGIFEAPESISDGEVVCLEIIHSEGTDNEYKVEIGGHQITNAKFENGCLNIYVDVALTPGYYNIWVTQNVGGTDTPLVNIGPLTHINVTSTILHSYDVVFDDPGTLTINKAGLTADVSSNDYQVEICDKIC